MNNYDIKTKNKIFRTYNAQDILDAREERVKLKDSIIQKYHNTVIMMRVNYPGIQKDNMLTRDIMYIMYPKLKSLFKDCMLHYIMYTAEGPVAVIAAGETAYAAKEKTVEFEENHVLGRCMDIDAYDKEGKAISRTQLGFTPRKCYICGDMAQNCVRSGRHSKEEIVRFIYKKYEEYMRNI